MNKRVALIGENSKEYISLLIHIWNSGDSAVLIDWRIPINISVRMMKQANVSKCYIESKFLLDGFIEDNIIMQTYVSEEDKAVLMPDEIYKEFIPIYDKREAVILYSSGTTGESKGIILSHYAINTNADAIIRYMDLTDHECFCIIKSLAHSSTLVGELLVCLKTRTRAIIAKTAMHPRMIVNLIISKRITIICVNPTILILLSKVWNANVDTCLKKIYTSGSVLHQGLLEKVKGIFEGVAIYNVYGLSEAGPRVSAQTSSYCTCNSVGKAINEVLVKVISSNGKSALVGEIGTVNIKTKSAFTGYVNTAISDIVVNNWINTKDLGYLDENGELFIVGRADDVIVRSAHKIYPASIETVIMSYDGIEDCFVFGHPDEILGEQIICMYQSKYKVKQMELILYCEERLASYEIPNKWIAVTELIRNQNGKMNRGKNKERFYSIGE